MSGEPRFFTENRIGNECGVVVSSGAATAGRLWDRDKQLKWCTQGEGSDLDAASIEVEFRAGGVEWAQAVDTVAVLGHNWKHFAADRWDGASWIEIFSVTETQDYTVREFTPVTTSRIRFRVDNTRVADQEKEAGEILVLATLWAPPADVTWDRLAVEWKPVSRVKRMMDDGLRVDLLRWAGARTDRWTARAGFQFLTLSQFAQVMSVVRAGQFILRPEPEETPDEFYLVTATPAGTPRQYTTAGYKAPGVSVDLSLEEV